MKQCCVLREDTGRRCDALVPDEDEICNDCCDRLEREIVIQVSTGPASSGNQPITYSSPEPKEGKILKFERQ